MKFINIIIYSIIFAFSSITVYSLPNFINGMHIGNPNLLRSKENRKYYKANGQVLLNLFKAYYNRNKDKLSEENSDYKIPKIIHYIWLGGNGDIPKKFLKWKKETLKLHPDWECKIWSEKDLQDFKMVNRNLFDKAKNYGEKSDIWRYEILYQIGGVYLDCDVECLKSMDQLHKNYDFYAGLEPFWSSSQTKALSLGNAIIGSVKNHPILASCIKNIKNRGHLKFHKSNKLNTVMRTGPMLLTLSCFENMKKSSNTADIIFPSKLFYPLLTHHSNIKPFFKHYWTHSWIK